MKKIKLLCIAIIMIMLLTPLSMAVGDSFKLSLEPLSNEVTRGDTFDVKVFLDDIQVVSGDNTKKNNGGLPYAGTAGYGEHWGHAKTFPKEGKTYENKEV